MTSQMRTRVIPFALLALFVIAPAAAQDQDNSALTAETYLEPPPEIAEAVLAPSYRNATLRNTSPDGRLVLNEVSSGPPSIVEFAKPFYRLGGLQIDWRANRDRRYTTRGGAGVQIVNIQTGESMSLQTPDGANVSSATWSPDASRVAFFVHTDQATHIYVADAENGRSRQVTRTPVLGTLYSDIVWTADSRSILTVLVPQDRGAAPQVPAVPTGPQVRLTTPETNRLRTYPDLLEGPHEQELLEYYTTGQLAMLDVERRSERRIGEPAMIQEVDLAPDGAHAIVTTMQKPFSYIVPVRSFANTEQIWDLENGSVVATLAENEVDAGAPDDSTDNDDGAPEKRQFAWRPDGQGLSFLQMAPRAPRDSSAQEESEGEGRGRSGRKDRVYQWLPPYDSSSMAMLYESANRLSGVRYPADAQILFLTERQGQRMHEYAVFLSDTSTKHTVRRGEGEGFRMDAPDVLTRTLPNGVEVVRLSADGNSVFLSDTEYHDDPLQEGPQSFIDRLELRTGEKERVYESENGGVYESVLAVLNDDVTELLVQREGPSDVPDTFFRDVSSGQTRQLTQNVDYTPDLTRAQRRRYNVERADGFEFAVDVTLPESWRDGERLPGMIWFYPREYTGQDDYDETRERYNRNSFPSIRARSMDILVRQGYAVIAPDAPIIGESGRMNDNYEHDLRNNLAATIDFLDREGIIDRQRMGVGGHSYGAFGTVNAMVHTPFFKAGIAGDGNFNRTLTPFAFQSERRTLWEAPEIYIQMSPMFHANDLTGALLMYHGEHDQNVGTFPINSWRLFEAMEALGKTASLYVYPYEDHGPATEETLLDLWARWTAWLDKYVKNADSPEQRATTDGGGS